MENGQVPLPAVNQFGHDGVSLLFPSEGTTHFTGLDAVNYIYLYIHIGQNKQYGKQILNSASSLSVFNNECKTAVHRNLFIKLNVYVNWLDKNFKMNFFMMVGFGYLDRVCL